MKNNIFKLVKVILICIVVYFIYSIGNAVYLLTKGHRTDFLLTEKNKWIFNDSYKKNVDTISFAYVTEKDILSNYRYYLKKNNENICIVRIWEINNIQQNKFNSLYVNFDVNLKKEIEPNEYEILDSKSDFSIVIKYDYEFGNGFNLNFPKSDSSVYYENKKEYKYVYGKFDYITITNGKKEEQIVFRNMHSNNYTAFFVFRKNKKNYLALVHSDFYFSKDIAKIFSFYK
jgi:hypothetical protein